MTCVNITTAEIPSCINIITKSTPPPTPSFANIALIIGVITLIAKK